MKKLNLLLITAIIAGALTAVSCDNFLHDMMKTKEPVYPIAEVESIVVIGTPTKQFYRGEISGAGGAVNHLAGITVTAVMSDSSTRDITGWITAAMLSSGDNFTTSGDKNITITVNGHSGTPFTIHLYKFIRTVGTTKTYGDDLKTLVDGAAGQTAAITLYDDAPNSATTTINTRNTVITLTTPDSAVRTISKDAANSGTLFTVTGARKGSQNNPRLIVDGYVTLQGTKTGNTESVIRVLSGARLDLQGHAKVTGNTTTGSRGGGGVYAEDFGGDPAILTLSGDAEISGNTSNIFGGGVVLYESNCTMSGNAKIIGNTAGNYNSSGQGGGVYLSGASSFVMTGGEISGNIAEGWNANGGGIYTIDSEFFFNGGVIRDNVLKYIAGGAGGGVYIVDGTDMAHMASIVMSGAAQITPKPGGDIIAGGLVNANGNPFDSYIDNRNSLAFYEVTSRMAVYGTLSADPAALVDIGYSASVGPFNFDRKYLMSADGPGPIPAPTITGYTNGAPISKFPLGKFNTMTGIPYTTFDLAAGGLYRDGNDQQYTLPPVTWSGDGTIDEKK